MNDDMLQAPWQRVNEWLRQFGFDHDPFRVPDAHEDERLHEYLVAHETFETIRGDQVSFVFAPAGGGKSAFRTRLARACRVGENGRWIFPIVYVPPEAVILAAPATRWHAHLQAILLALALELLLRLAYRPDEFSDLDTASRQKVRLLFERHLPGPLSHLLDQLQAPDGLLRFAHSYDRSAQWPKSPTPETLNGFCDSLLTTPKPSFQSLSPEADADIGFWLDLLLGPLNFEAVYLLVDGADAYPETIHDPQETLDLLSPLFERAHGWAVHSLFLKAFLPAELEPAFRSKWEQLTITANLCRIEWTQDMLIGLIRRRVEAALGASPGSLDMLCDPGLRDVDRLIVESVDPYPREVLVFIERLFFEHVYRAGAEGKLTRADLNAARQWYKS